LNLQRLIAADFAVDLDLDAMRHAELVAYVARLFYYLGGLMGERERLLQTCRAAERFRSTAIVADEFPEVRDNFDRMLADTLAMVAADVAAFDPAIPLRVAPDRPDLGTGIHVRAFDGQQWLAADIGRLDPESIARWLRSRGGANLWAESVVLHLLGHAVPG
jgi:hypothetical protein